MMSKLVDRIGQFTTIPNSVIQLWPKIGSDAICLFLYLRYRTNNQSEMSFPSYATISADTGMRRERIAKAVRALESAGLLERKRRFSASTIYILKLPDVISPPVGLMDDPISPPVGLPLVHLSDTNQIDLNKKKELVSVVDSAVKAVKTRDIQVAYESCVIYPVDWKAGEGHAAKWLADNGYTPDDVRACYAEMKKDQFWKDIPLSLTSVKKRIGQWKSTREAKHTIKLTGVVNA